MPEVRRIYRLNSASVEELNFVLSQLGDRLDQLEGFRGKGNFLVAPSSEQLMIMKLTCIELSAKWALGSLMRC